MEDQVSSLTKLQKYIPVHSFRTCCVHIAIRHTVVGYSSKYLESKVKYTLRSRGFMLSCGLVLCTGAGVPEPEPEFWPILPETSRSRSLFNSGKTPAVHTLCCKFLRTSAKKSKSIDEKVLKYSHATDTVCLPQTKLN